MLGFIHGLSISQVLSYASADMDDIDMVIARLRLEGKLSDDDAQLCVNPLFSSYQKDAILVSLERGDKREYLSLLSSNVLTESQIVVIEEGILEGLSVEQIKICSDPMYSEEQMQQLLLAFESGVNNDMIAPMLDPQLTTSQMARIRENLQKEADEAFMRNYAQELCNELINDLLEAGILSSPPQLTPQQMREIQLTLDAFPDIQLYKLLELLDPQNTPEQIAEIRSSLKPQKSNHAKLKKGKKNKKRK